MANGRGEAYRNATLDADLASARLALCMTTAPSATSAATGLTAGSGYTAGGELISVSAASGGIAVGPSGSSMTFTNSSGVPWEITGVVIHTAGAAHPTAAQMLYFNDDLAVSVPDGGQLILPIDSLTFTEA